MLEVIGKICFQSAMDEALELAKSKVGGASGLATKLGNLTPQAVSQWKRVPADRVIAVEDATGVSRHLLRPDVFGKPDSTPAENQGAAA